MISNRMKLQIAVLLSLGVVAGAELAYYLFEDTILEVPVHHLELPDQIEVPEFEFLKYDMESYSELVERPLFFVSRRPPEKQAVAVVQQQYIPQNIDWILMGTYTKQGAQYAMLVKVAEPKNIRKLTVGDVLDGWKIKKINFANVVLEYNGTEKVLELRKDRLPKSPAPANATSATTPDNVAPVSE